MVNEEKIISTLAKIYEGEMAVITDRNLLPDSFANDMNGIFNTDPEKEIISNVYWCVEVDGCNTDGVIAIIGNKLSKDEVCKKLIDYAKEKDIEELHLLYMENDCYYMDDYDSTGDSFEYGSEVNYDGFNVNVVDMENMYFGKNTRLGFEFHNMIS